MASKSLFAFKHGDVASGNWSWAIGAKADISARPLHLATLNFYGCNAAGHDCEKLAPIMAEAPAMLEALRQSTQALVDGYGYAPAEMGRAMLVQIAANRAILARIDGEV